MRHSKINRKHFTRIGRCDAQRKDPRFVAKALIKIARLRRSKTFYFNEFNLKIKRFPVEKHFCEDSCFLMI